MSFNIFSPNKAAIRIDTMYNTKHIAKATLGGTKSKESKIKKEKNTYIRNHKIQELRFNKNNAVFSNAFFIL